MDFLQRIHEGILEPSNVLEEVGNIKETSGMGLGLNSPLLKSCLFSND